jgi:flagellar basal-body rod protein FlgB
LIGGAMQAAVVRNEVCGNNIANVDTPGFKKSVVDFESFFSTALQNAQKTGVIDMRDVTVEVRQTRPSFQFRMDENNVDIESEMVALYENAVRYDTLAAALLSNGKRMNVVLSGRQG